MPPVGYDVSLITPTRERPEAVALCQRWMGRQRYHGSVQWIIVDDSPYPSPHMPLLKFKLPGGGTIHRTVVRRDPEPNSVQSFAGNILNGINWLRAPKVLIIEDDDWYDRYYLRQMTDRLDHADLVGEIKARYYHVRTRRYNVGSNLHHASLCRTGLRADFLPRLQHACELARQDNNPWIDLYLWGTRPGVEQDFNTNLFDGANLSVGMKGLPGRGGLGSGHARGNYPGEDPDGVMLRHWLGADADAYLGYYEPAAVA